MPSGYNGKLASLSNHKISHGFHTIDVAVPAGKGRASIVVYSVRDGAVSSTAVNVERADKRDVKLVAESFRDKLVPGSGEQWRFRLTRQRFCSRGQCCYDCHAL